MKLRPVRRPFVLIDFSEPQRLVKEMWQGVQAHVYDETTQARIREAWGSIVIAPTRRGSA